ncbi:MAG: hypothetical protein JXR37_17035 [Kiritimatiellae bacterium]|nr:hypothetical protein [Kiritimatiellia bacterium]
MKRKERLAIVFGCLAAALAAWWVAPARACDCGAPEAAVDEWYETLAPYGCWLDTPEFGLVWQPQLTVADRSWRPYGQGGHWVRSDLGWYWQSYYPWGHVVFHYGRWLFSAYHRWIWVPDSVWGPAWVCWRYSPTHFGWAPLPPSTCAGASVGVVWTDGDVAWDFRLGLSDYHYVYVPCADFLAVDLGPVFVYRGDVSGIHRHTTLVCDSHHGRGHDRHARYGDLPEALVSGSTRRTIGVQRVLNGRLEGEPAPSRRTSGVLGTVSAGGRAERILSQRSFVPRTESAPPPRSTPSPAPPRTGSSSRSGGLLSLIRREVRGNASPAPAGAPRGRAPQEEPSRRSTATYKPYTREPAPSEGSSRLRAPVRQPPSSPAPPMPRSTDALVRQPPKSPAPPAPRPTSGQNTPYKRKDTEEDEDNRSDTRGSRLLDAMRSRRR